jgi:hypothetical protein
LDSIAVNDVANSATTIVVAPAITDTPVPEATLRTHPVRKNLTIVPTVAAASTADPRQEKSSQPVATRKRVRSLGTSKASTKR